MTVILSVLGVVCVIWGVVAALLIAAYLQKRGKSINYIWLRMFILKYIGQYVKLTREETGHIGSLFYHYVIPLNVALVVLIVFIVRGWK